MKKGILVLILIGTGAIASAQTQQLKAGQIYMGKEAVNEHATGNNCFISVHEVMPYSDKGLHCYSAVFDFNSVREDMPKQPLKVDSRVTNYHRPEFPKVRTCAMNVDGTTSGNEIYGEDTTLLYNQIFGGDLQVGGTMFDFFLTLDPVKKTAIRARVHVRKTFDEYDVDCTNLELM